MRTGIFVLGTTLLSTLTAAAGERTAGDKPVDNFSLPDVRTCRPVALADFKDRPAVVVIFLGTACPINNAYLPRLAELHKQYAAKGVQFLAVNSLKTDKPDEVAAHAKKHDVPFPVLKDSSQHVAELFDARRTPEAFVLDGKRVVRYRGRIDDQFAVDVNRKEPTKSELKDALDAMLAGKPVAVAETEVAGCLITRGRKLAAKGTVTFAGDVAKILQKNCQECHRPGQIGPMPLLTYEDAEGWSAMIREVVADRRMPPWYADPKIGHFSNDRSLPERDRETLLAWIDQGCVRGDSHDLPPAAQFPSEWRIGKPDVVFTMPRPFDVPAEMPRFGISYKYFVIETNFAEDMWVERAEARAGSPEVVHHVIAFVVPPKGSDEAQPPGPPLLPPVPGVAAEASRATVLCGTAPGDMPLILRPGFARKIPAGARIVLQMHYTPNGKAQSDASSIALVFAKKPPEYRVLSLPVLQYQLKIPAGDANFQVESWGPFDMKTRKSGFEEDALILGFMPHMHLRGKDFFIELAYPDGKREAVLNVPRFNFNWQNVYRFETPLRVPKGTKVHCVAHFDNSLANPNNPDAEKAVGWGDQTWQEMMIGWTDFAYARKP
ncbi:MAG: redoxin domain-containing protein [Gemmataceae bacterium]